MQGEDQKCITVLDRKPESERTLRRPRQNNNKINRREMGHEVVNWIQEAKCSNGMFFAKTIINLWVP